MPLKSNENTEQASVSKEEPSHFKALILARHNGDITEEHAINAAKENPLATAALLRHSVEGLWVEKGIRTALQDRLTKHLFQPEQQ